MINGKIRIISNNIRTSRKINNIMNIKTSSSNSNSNNIMMEIIISNKINNNNNITMAINKAISNIMMKMVKIITNQMIWVRVVVTRIKMVENQQRLLEWMKKSIRIISRRKKRVMMAILSPFHNSEIYLDLVVVKEVAVVAEVEEVEVDSVEGEVEEAVGIEVVEVDLIIGAEAFEEEVVVAVEEEEVQEKAMMKEKIEEKGEVASEEETEAEVTDVEEEDMNLKKKKRKLLL